MSGYYFLAFSLMLAFVGIGFYLLGPTLKQWDEELTRQLNEIEAKRRGDSRGPDERAAQAGVLSAAVQPEDIDIALASPSHQAAPRSVEKNVGVAASFPCVAAFRTGQQVYVRAGLDRRGMLVPRTLKSGMRVRRLSSKLRRGVGTLAGVRLSSAPLRRVPARTLGGAR